MTFVQRYKNELQVLCLASVCFIATLGAFVFISIKKDAYPASGHWVTYSDDKISFKYPERWDMDLCSADGMDFRLPGKIASDTSGDKVQIYGNPSGRGCSSGNLSLKPAGLPICEPEKVNVGIHLKNDLFVSFDRGSEIAWISIGRSQCDTASIFTFRFLKGDPKLETPTPKVSKDVFVNSPQYKDIVKFAESIRFKDN